MPPEPASWLALFFNMNREGRMGVVASQQALEFAAYGRKRPRFEVRWPKPMIIWSSEKGSMVDALALSDEEGRGKLRKARVRSKHLLTPG